MSSTTSPQPTATVTTIPTGPATGPASGRTYSTRELHAAAVALAAGQFTRAQASMSPVTGPTSPPEPALTRRTEATAMDLVERGAKVTGLVRTLGPLVRVRAANAGAGASTITLALADAADRAGMRTRVLDAAAPAWSGLIGASVTELGASDGWRCGRRGAGVLIDRVAAPISVPEFVPAPRQLNGIDLTVLDTGWTSRELDACTVDGGCWVVRAPAHVEVVVTRPNALALGQAEAVLAGIAGVHGRRPTTAATARGPERAVRAAAAGQGAAWARSRAATEAAHQRRPTAAGPHHDHHRTAECGTGLRKRRRSRMFIHAITETLTQAVTASGGVRVEALNDVCAKAPTGVDSYVTDILGWVKYGVIAIIIGAGFASCGAMIVGKIGSMGRAAQVGASGLFWTVLGAIAFVTIYGVLHAIVGNGC
jgi:hypothetical protein